MPTQSNRELYKMLTQSVIQSSLSFYVVGSAVWHSALPARLFIIHPMHTAFACTVQSMKEQHYNVRHQKKTPKLNCLPNLLIINLILS